MRQTKMFQTVSKISKQFFYLSKDKRPAHSGQ
uniref:Uncharacterized protein n=1 Tax=Arundo donax TaxID=35708 RepID=A0A0A8ZX23_ARUDO